MSQVTAFAPELCQFNQATTSIYWIDAQWSFPASVVAECGKPHVLTTTVFRRTNGAPLAGWIVRYTIGSGGSLGYEGGNTIDARTDAMGRASVEVSPSQAGSGVTQVGITIIRPQSVSPNTIPQVELARGAAAITWSTNAPPVAPGVPIGPPAPGLPAPPVGPVPLGPPPSLPMQPSPMQPSLPPTGPTPAQQPPPGDINTTQPNTFAPPPAGRPRLEATLAATSAEQVAVGQFASWELTITNRGDGVARHIKVEDQFDQGLTHEMDLRNTHVIQRSEGIRELAPNDSERINLTFKVAATGRQCHTVTVTADGSEPAMQQACVIGTQASLEVKISGERTRIVGETTTFTVSIRNTGSTAAANVELRVAFDPVQSIEPIVESGMERLQDGSILVRLNGELAPDERRSGLRIQGRCRAPVARACARATVSSMGGANSNDETCLEILPTNPAAAPGAAAR